ncbi:MAG: hypothetical protein ACR2PT_15500, partial [Endozoicomonas sp.]
LCDGFTTRQGVLVSGNCANRISTMLTEARKDYNGETISSDQRFVAKVFDNQYLAGIGYIRRITEGSESISRGGDAPVLLSLQDSVDLGWSTLNLRESDVNVGRFTQYYVNVGKIGQKEIFPGERIVTITWGTVSLSSVGLTCYEKHCSGFGARSFAPVVAKVNDESILLGFTGKCSGSDCPIHYCYEVEPTTPSSPPKTSSAPVPNPTSSSENGYTPHPKTDPVIGHNQCLGIALFIWVVGVACFKCLF